jgi:hypothetical protein
MGFASKAVSIELMKKLSSLSYAAYQSYCRDLIAGVLPNTEASKEMRELDRAGVDLFLLNNRHITVELAFQCKGFEVSHAKEEQVRQCVKSIRSLEKLPFPVKKYYLLVNRVIYPEERKILEAEMQAMVEKKKIEEYELLDNPNFIQFLYKHIKRNFVKAISKSNRLLYNEYKKNLDQRFYYEPVPFELNGKDLSSDPGQFLRKGFGLNKTGEKKSIVEYEPGKYFFIIGDFGFGKTSLMFRSIAGLEGYNAIYLPLSYFQKQDFQNQMEFAKVINKMVTGEENTSMDLFIRFKSKVLTNILCNNPKIILLFDAMDENIHLANKQTLQLLFSILKEVKAQCVFSMRKSFWEERQGNFEATLPKRRAYKDRIKLLEWSNDNILGYVELYGKHHQLDSREMDNLSAFKELVRSNRYHSFYGDIPKRPLFLEMILQDAIEGNVQKTHLSALYEKYFYRKFVWDNESRFDSIPHGRPSTFSEDIYKGFNDIAEMMEDVAGLMIKYDGDDSNEVLLAASIGEKRVRPLLESKGIGSINAFLLNSVLTTEAARTLKGLNMTFAHRSYQDYFTARYLFKQIVDYAEDRDKMLHSDFPSEVTAFLLDYTRWKNETEEILEHPGFVEVLSIDWLKGSLGYELKAAFGDNSPESHRSGL